MLAKLAFAYLVLLAVTFASVAVIFIRDQDVTCREAIVKSRELRVLEFNEGSLCYIYRERLDCVWSSEEELQRFTTTLGGGRFPSFEGYKRTDTVQK